MTAGTEQRARMRRNHEIDLQLEALGFIRRGRLVRHVQITHEMVVLINEKVELWDAMIAHNVSTRRAWALVGDEARADLSTQETDDEED
jgi:hypothetical protein